MRIELNLLVEQVSFAWTDTLTCVSGFRCACNIEDCGTSVRSSSNVDTFAVLVNCGICITGHNRDVCLGCAGINGKGFLNLIHRISIGIVYQSF